MLVKLGKGQFDGALPEVGDRVIVIARPEKDDAAGYRLVVREVQKGKDVLLRARSTQPGPR